MGVAPGGRRANGLCGVPRRRMKFADCNAMTAAPMTIGSHGRTRRAAIPFRFGERPYAARVATTSRWPRT